MATIDGKRQRSHSSSALNLKVFHPVRKMCYCNLPDLMHFVTCYKCVLEMQKLVTGLLLVASTVSVFEILHVIDFTEERFISAYFSPFNSNAFSMKSP